MPRGEISTTGSRKRIENYTTGPENPAENFGKLKRSVEYASIACQVQFTLLKYISNEMENQYLPRILTWDLKPELEYKPNNKAVQFIFQRPPMSHKKTMKSLRQQASRENSIRRAGVSRCLISLH